MPRGSVWKDTAVRGPVHDARRRDARFRRSRSWLVEEGRVFSSPASTGGDVSSWATPRAWPPSPLDEVAELFAGVGTGRYPRPGDEPLLFEACRELDLWLGDTRRYTRRLQRTDEWSSLTEEFRCATSGPGPLLRGRAVGLDRVAAALHGSLGRDAVARGVLRVQLRAARSALADPQASVDAFDDLWAAVSDPDSSQRQVSDRFSVLHSVLAFASRSMSTVASTLAGVARDDVMSVASARHALDGVEVPEHLLDPERDAALKAGLSVVERLELIRRLLKWRPARNGHVVWVFYGRARFQNWILQFGPVTFIDGPQLLSVFDQLDEAGPAGLGSPQNMWWFRDLPSEVVEGEEAPFLRWKHNWPSDIERWVAARVDLGPGPHLDPVGEARRQADALVGLAQFHGNSTYESWVALTGHLEVVDGERRGASWPMRERERNTEDWWLRDNTDSWLVENQSELEVHWPVSDEALAELVECIAVLNEANRTIGREEDAGIAPLRGNSGAVSSPVVFLQRVRVLELLASRIGVGWVRLMQVYLRDAWVREQVLERVFRAVERATANGELCRHEDALDRVRAGLLTQGDGLMVTTHRDVALAALPDLATRLPAHQRQARQVREVAADVADVAALESWVHQLREEYRRTSGRALRCRNSLTHGGPFDAAAVASVNAFIGWQAGLATVTALRGVLSGSSIDAALEAKRVELTTWAAQMNAATDVADALVPSAMPRTQSRST
jgi:hypothetical protein